MNPQHTVPVLDDNGTIVCESHAIMIYLVSKYGKDDSLYSKELVKQAKLNAALHFESGVLFARLRFVFVSILERDKYLCSSVWLIFVFFLNSSSNNSNHIK